MKITYRNDRNSDVVQLNEPDARLESLDNWHRVDAAELAALEQPPAADTADVEPEATTGPTDETEVATSEQPPTVTAAAKPARKSRARQPRKA